MINQKRCSLCNDEILVSDTCFEIVEGDFKQIAPYMKSRRYKKLIASYHKSCFEKLNLNPKKSDNSSSKKDCYIAISEVLSKDFNDSTKLKMIDDIIKRSPS